MKTICSSDEPSPILFDPKLMDPTQPTLWWCLDAFDTYAIGTNAVCKSSMVRWGETAKYQEVLSDIVAGLNDLVERYSSEAKYQKDAAARLEKELAELKSRPVEVAVEADPAAVETARKEAEAAMRDKLDKARAAEKKARDEAVRAANDVSRTERELKQAQAELDALRARAELAEKKAALTADEDLALFRMLFDQAQEIKNKMNGVVLKVRPKDPEKAQGLAKALFALADSFREVAAQ